MSVPSPELSCTRLEVSGRTIRARIQWPEGLGSWQVSVVEDLEKLADWVEDHAPCDVLVLHPEGEAAIASAPPTIDQCRRLEKLAVRFDRLECVSIAVLDGPSVRAWMQLALACDLRLATSRASLKVLELKEGYLPGMNTFRLAKFVGLGVARRLLFTGDAMSSEQAAGLGLVDELGDDVESTLARLLDKVAAVRPVQAKIARRLLNESFATMFEDFLGQYLASQNRCLGEIAPKGDRS